MDICGVIAAKKDSKRVKNTKMKKNLKVKLKYPTYKEGLSNIYSHLS